VERVREVKFRDVEEQVRGIPFTSAERGRELYDFVMEMKPQRCLELGFAHGVSTCYIAAALQEVGNGRIDAVDLVEPVRDPCAEELLIRCGLAGQVDIFRERNSYTWFLKKEIETNTGTEGICIPCYDFIFVDGPKNWTIDGAAFFMADKLLKPGGVILFDDYNYAYGSADGATDGITHRELSDDERTEPHVKAIFHLLVMQHPKYGAFEIVNEQWAWAKKTGGADRTMKVIEHVGIREKALRFARKVRASTRA
jgi:predicted O-methyltransferase YrrM